MADRRPLRERPKLLVDLSEKVSEDLRISTPTLTPRPQLRAKAGPRVNGGHLSANNLRVASVGVRTTGAGPQARRLGARMRPMPLSVRERLKAKIRNVVPEDGEVIWTLVFHEWWNSPGTAWINEMEYMFWLGTPNHVEHSIDEWLNAEFEHVCDVLSDPMILADADWSWGDPREGLELSPTEDQLYQAWEEVAMSRPDSTFAVSVVNASKDIVTLEHLSAQDLMDPLGLSLEGIQPVIMIADSVTEQDYDALMADKEVYLNGYLIDRVEEHELVTIHIVPPQ